MATRAATGVVRWFHEAHGYGFIEVGEQDKPLYFHHTDIEGRGYRSLSPGQRVHYELATEGAQIRAIEVRSVR